MSKQISLRPSLKTVLKTSTVAGLAALMLSTGIPAQVVQSFAEPVKVTAPQVASFGDVVDAVSPAVVSVRVQSDVKPVSDEGDGNSFNFNFGGRGFDDLPDDHPLKRFFREFGGGQDGPRADRGPHRFGDRDGKRKGHMRPTSQGSGFIISEDGYIVTNNHVVDDGAAFTIVLNDGSEVDAKLVGKDSRTDLAVLKIDNKENRKFTYVSFADDSKVRVGDWVVAVGNPFGLGGTVTAGIISARGRDIGSGPYDDYLQIDAAVNRGNSGGPAFNLDGQVVGINTAIFSPSGGNVGIAFAIPASVAKDVVADLMKDGKVERGWLGVQIQPVTKDIAESLGLAEAQGALVVEPQAGSPGEKAGIKKGDVITALDGDPIKDPRDLAKRVALIAPGTETEFSVWRNGKSETVKVEIAKLEADQQASASPDQATPDEPQSSEEELADLGIAVSPSDDGNGVTVAAVDPDSDASDRGLKEGDRITSVNNKEIKSAEDITKVIDQARKDGRSKALFQVETDGGSRFVALPIDQG
ncbi:serine protease Do [Rhizobium azooxidifex]|uniref:Probable periplasmic serine endoprotease DegP-like n=1 Tax=Mycoplana azooxidifex TaxID=1636188 RepID=A0A7W6D8I3_9HYPH|nr:Do family serine endopeptidase [Mycoplana azooxidifex]MBB3978640.1 serine protease Do [Mycoplana azooxidifex]